MIIFPFLLVQAAAEAGMKYPTDPDNFDPNEFPHFQVFCNIQLSRPASPTEHWENAVKIAAIPEDKIRTMTMPDFRELGVTF